MTNDSTPHNTDYGSYASLRKLVFSILEGNETLTPKQIEGILHVSYGVRDVDRQTIANYKQDFRKRTYKVGLPQKPHRRTFEWFVRRSVEYEKLALTPVEGRQGIWNVVFNRNGMLVFRYSVGSCHWYREGKVLVYVRGEVSWAKAKEIFSRAFLGVLTDKEIVEHVDAPVHEVGKHWVFDTGQLLPRFEIRQFERSHGLRIYSDGSHPTAIEVAETEPFWLQRLDQLGDTFKDSAVTMTKSMSEHLGLLGTMKDTVEKIGKESELRSTEVTDHLDVLSKSIFSLGSLLTRKRKPRAKSKPKPSRFQRLKRRLQR